MKNICSLFVLAALTASGLVHAQETKPIGLSARVGIFWPSAEDARRSGKNWFIGGLEYKLGSLRTGMMDPGFNSYYTVSADYYSKNDFRAVPILLNFVGRRDQWYYTAGVGIAPTKARLNTLRTRNSTEFAYQIGVGYDFVKGATPVFVELKWLGNGKSKLNGFATMVGVRF